MPRLLLCLAVLTLSAAFLRAAEFPTPPNSGTSPEAPALTAERAVAGLKLPEGFRATVFAGEPDVRNPIGMTWDARGRLWIAENYTYAERTLKFDLTLRDRVLIFEDRNGGGRFSSRRVFVDDVQRLTSVEVGRGGVWLMCPPQLLFVPDRDQDGVPDGPPEAVLDGFTIPAENYHNFANGLRFGPDGWLYGRCGGASPGEIGVPGTPKAARLPLRGTIWRYHPERRTVEVLGTGTTNPWGHDWDAHGELFFINTVNGHLWHGITGAHYARAATLDPNPRTYALIDHHADHWHFDTAFDWTKSRDGAANAHGGGHAHVGLMIYQGDNWPEAYRGKLYTLNFHGRRANTEVLERRGSGYVGRHGQDLFLSDDPWFRGIDLGYGPDGGVFVLDWSDTGECHNATGVHRGSGRIYKITHGQAERRGPADLTSASARELAALHAHANEWYVRQARLELTARRGRGHALTHAIEDLRVMFASAPSPALALRALWTLFVLGEAPPDFLRAQLRHPSEHVRTWAVRLLTDAWPLDTVLSARPLQAAPPIPPGLLDELIHLARTEASGLVRLALASTLQRLPPRDREALAVALVARREDAADHNLPLLLWYGLIPLADVDPAALTRIAVACELPATRRLLARRLAEDIETNPGPLNTLLAGAAGRAREFRADVVAGIGEGLSGWRRATRPVAWDAFAAKVTADGDATLGQRVRDLSVLFGDGRALDEVRTLALDAKADLTARKAALRSLIDARPPDLRSVCEQVIRVRFLNLVAARGLALFDDPAIGARLAGAYTSFHPTDRPALVDILVSRPSFAAALLAQIPAGRVARSDITAFHARQIRSFNDPELTARLGQVWGELRGPAADKQAFIASLRTELSPAELGRANRSQGRALYNAVCASCHTLYGQGGALGPDLTGAGRDNLDYLLENIADPGAVVTADYRMNVVRLKDGRTLNGFIAARTPRTLTIKGQGEAHTVERDDIVSTEESSQSVMPEGLLEALTPEQRRDLIAYLMHPTQVPLP